MAAKTLADCVQIVSEMIEEAQREANYCVNADDRRQLLAKRDALTEVKLRVRDGRSDHEWIRKVLPMPI